MVAMVRFAVVGLFVALLGSGLAACGDDDDGGGGSGKVCDFGSDCPDKEYCFIRGDADEGVCRGYPSTCGDNPTCDDDACFDAITAQCRVAGCGSSTSGDTVTCE